MRSRAARRDGGGLAEENLSFSFSSAGLEIDTHQYQAGHKMRGLSQQ
jgi:hypothetical protein